MSTMNLKQLGEALEMEIRMKPAITEEDVRMMSDLLDSVLNRYQPPATHPVFVSKAQERRYNYLKEQRGK